MIVTHSVVLFLYHTLQHPLTNVDVNKFLSSTSRQVSALTRVAADEHAFGTSLLPNNSSEPHRPRGELVR